MKHVEIINEKDLIGIKRFLTERIAAELGLKEKENFEVRFFYNIATVCIAVGLCYLAGLIITLQT